MRWLIRSVVVFMGLTFTRLNSSRWVLVACGIGISTVIGLSLSPIGDLGGLEITVGN